MSPDSEKKSIRVGILTISDTRTSSKSSAETFDSSGHGLRELIDVSNIIESASVVAYDCVPDDIEQIRAKMIEWCSGEIIDVLLSTGGTGIGPRDVTPEATLGIIEIHTPGISHAIMNASLKITPMAMLSRAVSGILKKTLIINLPGSEKASKECLVVVACTIPHAVSLIRNEQEISKQFHNQLNSKVHNQSKVPDCVSKIACRHRESPFPKISMELALSILKENASSQYNEKNQIMYPTIYIFSTGDELKSLNNTHSGHIRDTNSVMIKQILEQDNYRGQVLNCGIVRDNWNDLCKQFEEGFYNADIVVTSGGVSMGEKDFIKHVLKEHFKCHIHFGRVDMKPGMPTTFATLCFDGKKKYVFCLPGNPVSAGVCTHLFLLPYLRAISGRKKIVYSFKAKLTHSIDTLDVRPEFKRALMKYENGEFFVSCLTDYQQSSRLLSFVGSNCLLQLPSATKVSNIEKNTVMDVILIKSIENTYFSPILKEKNWSIMVLQKPNVKENTNDLCLSLQLQQSSSLCINEILSLMAENTFVLKTINIPTTCAMGYVLHSQVHSLENLPPFPASIKDGYAIKYMNGNSWSKKKNIFNVVQVSVAGTAPYKQEELREGECARISTGAPIPPGANCVVQVEDTAVVDKSSDETVEMTITISKEPKQFDNIRSIGSDISAGQCLLDEKTEIGPFEIALLCSVGCEELCVYEYPTIRIIPYISNITYRACNLIKNILKQDGFNKNLISSSLCNRLDDLLESNKHVFKNSDIIVICTNNDLHLDFGKNVNVETHFLIKHPSIKSDDEVTLLGFGVLHFDKKRMVFFHTTNCDSDYIYNCVHLFILPFLRFATGRKQCISSITTECENLCDLPIAKFEKSELKYEDGNFKVNCYSLNHQNCIAKLPISTKTINELFTFKTKIYVIITENSDSYFIRY